MRVLTNVVELKLADPEMLRIAAYKLNQVGERDLAIDLFGKVLKMRPEEPQSYRDLALSLADRADSVMKWHVQSAPSCPPEAAADYARSLELLNKVVVTPWDRFPGIEVIALKRRTRSSPGRKRRGVFRAFPSPSTRGSSSSSTSTSAS